MAHNAYLATRPANNWALSSAFLTVEITALALQVYQSLNGDLGGTWAPAAVITIGGSGLTVTGESRLNDAKNVAFGLNALCAFSSNASLAFGGTSALVMGTGTVFLLQSGVTATIACPLSVTGAAAISGNATFTGERIGSGSLARTKERITTATVNTDVTLSVTTDVLYASSSDGVDHVVTITDATGSPVPVKGEKLVIHFTRTLNTIGKLSIKNLSLATNIARFEATPGFDYLVNRGSLTVRFDGSFWIPEANVGFTLKEP